jgi:hypothetical protein
MNDMIAASNCALCMTTVSPDQSREASISAIASGPAADCGSPSFSAIESIVG